jgi:hypothetical protein
MNLDQITTKNFVMALFKRDDGERFLLGDGLYEFKDGLQHFQPNIIANDVVEKQGASGQLLAGQVARSASQSFDGYVGDATTTRNNTEIARRAFFRFFQITHFYTVVYILPNGQAIQRKNGYLTDAPSVPEALERFPEYHVALAFEDLNYYSYGEDAAGNETYAQVYQLQPESILTGGLVWDAIGVVWNSQIRTTFSGTNITEEMGDGRIEFSKIAGGTTQPTQSGKNLFDYHIATSPTTRSGLTINEEEDGTIVVSGVPTTNFVVISGGGTRTDITNILEDNTTYTIGKYDTNRYTFVEVRGLQVGGGYSYYGANTTASNTFTTDFANYVSYDIAILASSTSVWGTSSRTVRHKFQLEKGGTLTDFEPYCGGQPSPNPEYSQPVRTVTGEQTITINGTDYKLNLGKNLFDKDNANEFPGYVNGAGRIISSGNPFIHYIKCQPSTTYTVSKGCTDGTQPRFCVFDTEVEPAVGVDVIHSVGTRSGADTASSYTFTTSDRAHWLGLFCYVATEATYTEAEILATVQIEAGNTATAYAAYKTPIELCELGGTYQDYIWKDGEDWKVHKETASYTFDGSEGWFVPNPKTYPHLFQADNVAVMGFSSGYTSASLGAGALCPELVFRTSGDVRTNQGFALYNSSTGQTVRLNNSAITTLTELDNWLSSLQVSATYALATPTETVITDQALINQLESIRRAATKYGQNVISVTSAGANLTGSITINPAIKGNAGGAVWDEETGHSTTTLTVTSLFPVNPIWIVPGPAESPLIENITNNTSLSYLGNIPAGQTLVVDCGAQTATLAGANVKNNIRGTWQTFQPGQVTIRYSGANITGPSTLEWNEVVE